MPYPRIFFQLQPNSAEAFQKRDSGNLSFKRLLLGHSDFWISPTPHRDEKQKKLLFTSCFAQTWSEEQRASIAAKLEQLLDDNFVVYAWQNTRLEKISKDDLPRLLYDANWRSNLFPEQNQTMTEAAAQQYKIANDSLLILDDYWLDNLMLDSDTLPSRDLSIHAFTKINRAYQIKTLKWLIQAEPPLTSLKLDELSIKAIRILTWVHKQVPDTSIEYGPYTLIDEAEMSEFDQLVEEPYRSSVTIDFSEFSKELLSKKDLLFAKACASEALKYSQRIITKPHQQFNSERKPSSPSMLSKRAIQNINGALASGILTLSTKKELSIHDSEINSDQLNALLKRDQQIEILSITEYCPNLTDAFTITPGSLFNLTYLSLCSPKINVHLFTSLLKAAPLLAGLYLSNEWRSPIDLPLLKPNSLPNLKEINIQGKFQSVTQFEAFLKAALNLEILKLDASNIPALKPGSLPNLKELDINDDNDNMDSENLGLLLAATPQLERLNIYCPVQGGFNYSLTPNSLPQLMQITIRYYNIGKVDEKFLMKLQAAAPKAQILIIYHEDSLKDSLADEAKVPLPLAGLPPMPPGAGTATYSGSAGNSRGIGGDPAVLPGPSTNTPTKNNRSASQPVDEQHAPSIHKDFKPTEDTAPFKFTGDNISKNQGMIIEKLSQYLTLKHTNLRVIAKLQDGICKALTEFFLAQQRAPWDQFIKDLLEWNGQVETLTDSLEGRFIKLFEYVQKHQLDPAHIIRHYLGDDLSTILSSCPSPCRLFNPWHAVVIRRKESSTLWEVYDPNFVDGVREVADDALLDTLHFALGKLISSPDITIRPQVRDKAAFLEQGGLLTLTQCGNVRELLESFIPVEEYPIRALEGLLLRNTQGIPAWIRGIQRQETRELTLKLLEQFIRKNSEKYAQELQSSMECLKPCQRLDLETLLIQNAQEDSEKICRLVLDLVDSSPSATQDYKERLKTWERAAPQREMSALEYCQSQVSSDKKKQLIEFATAKDKDAFHYALQDYCRSTQRPIFYVHSPDDLICAIPYYDASGVLCKGPSGALHEFLSSHPDGVLMVNYGAFQADDLVRFNTLLDKTRKTDVTLVPTETLIIGLLNKDNPIVPGSDFYSRFDKVERCPLTSLQLQASVPKLPEISKEPESTRTAGVASAYCIDLYHAQDWENLLIGHWVPNGDRWHYQEGALVQAIKSGAHKIDIYNGLWNNEDFCRFWRELSQSSLLHTPTGTLTVPKGMQFSQKTGYSWQQLKSYFKQEKKLSDTPHTVLNPETFNEFFGVYQITNKNQLQVAPGHISKASEKVPAVLLVHLTHSLTEDNWARLLKTCGEKNVHLQVYCAPGVTLPEVLQTPRFVIKSIPDAIQGLPMEQGIIQSSDVDTTLYALKQHYPKAIVWDISECDASDLISRITGGLINKKDEPIRFSFEEKTCALTQALERGDQVILKGRCSEALAQQLAPLLLQRPNITVVSEDVRGFSYLPHYNHTVTSKEKREALTQQFSPLLPAIEPYLDTEPLSSLETRCRFMHSNPEAQSDSSWAGLNDSAFAVSDPGTVSEDSLTATTTFTQKRTAAINAVLAHEPYVFLTGLSGVGKSTFVMEHLSQGNDVLCVGESSIHEWVKKPKADERKLLFIDEANLSPSEWSAFEGLFNKPPGILISGVYYPLTSEHKVIFAGNPLSYGDERTLAPLFARHGNAVVFDPLPSDVLFEQILKPVFKDTDLESQALLLSKHFLEVYRSLCSISTTDVLISPRELQMMALLTVSHCEQVGSIEHAEDVAKHFAYALGNNLMPKGRQLPKPDLSITLAPPTKQGEYLITPSRQAVYQLLDEYLNLQSRRRNFTGNKEQLYGGLGGILIEGEPGIGKSELTITALRAHGYEEMRDFNKPATCDKPFYSMPVSMTLAEKESLLLKAFNEGAVVLIDEINSSPMMERLLNALLMGSDLDGKRPAKPGFMVIGTQNPITMAGRRAQSTALSRRMTSLTLPPFTKDELRDILISQGLPAPTATSLAHAFQEQVAYAKARNLNPAPTPRALLRLAKDIQRGRLAAEIAVIRAKVNLKVEQHHPAVLDTPTSLSNLIYKYFGNKPEELGGIFGTYTKETEKNTAFQEFFSKLQQIDSSLGIRSISMRFSELHTLTLAYQTELSEEKYHQLSEVLDKLLLIMPKNPFLQNFKTDLVLLTGLGFNTEPPRP